MLAWVEFGVGGGPVHRLHEGEDLHFGRGSYPKTAVDLVTSTDGRVSRVAGQVMAGREMWVVRNLSRYSPLRIIGDSGGGVIVLDPPARSSDERRRRSSAAVSWPSARIELALGSGRISIDVTARSLEFPTEPTLRTRETLPPTSMDKQRLYFQTLLVLCERRLTDATAVVVPSDQQVCDRLRETGLDPSATPKMVERRLADAREHLGLSRALLEQRGVPNSSLRSLIVDTAIATGAVRTHDLNEIGLA